MLGRSTKQYFVNLYNEGFDMANFAHESDNSVYFAAGTARMETVKIMLSELGFKIIIDNAGRALDIMIEL